MDDSTCSVDDCGRRSYRRGLCITHSRRYVATGVVGGPIKRKREVRPVCAVDCCDAPASASDLCDMHYQRVRRHGDAGVVLPPQVGPDHHGWKGESVSYAGLHSRLVRERGSAGSHLCVECGATADEWSYRHGDPGERIDSNGYPYTPNLGAYEPLCKPCHVRRDRRSA